MVRPSAVMKPAMSTALASACSESLSVSSGWPLRARQEVARGVAQAGHGRAQRLARRRLQCLLHPVVQAHHHGAVELGRRVDLDLVGARADAFDATPAPARRIARAAPAGQSRPRSLSAPAASRTRAGAAMTSASDHTSGLGGSACAASGLASEGGTGVFCGSGGAGAGLFLACLALSGCSGGLASGVSACLARVLRSGAQRLLGLGLGAGSLATSAGCGAGEMAEFLCAGSLVSGRSRCALPPCGDLKRGIGRRTLGKRHRLGVDELDRRRQPLGRRRTEPAKPHRAAGGARPPARARLLSTTWSTRRQRTLRATPAPWQHAPCFV